MKKIIISLAVLCIIIGKSFAAEPIVKLPSIPDIAVLELYEDSEELFAMKVLEYYQYAVAYRAQMQIWNPGEKLPAIQQPTLDELTSTDVDIIVKYYTIARQMNGIVTQLPDSESNIEIKSLRNKLLACALEKEEGEKRLFESQLDSKHLSIYATKWKHFISIIDSLVFSIDTLQLVHHDNLIELRRKLNKLYLNQWRHYMPILSASIEGYDIFTRSDNLDSKLSVGTTISLNAAMLLGLGRNIEFYFSYIYPKFISTRTRPEFYRLPGDLIYPSGDVKWNSDMYILGVKGNFPEIINHENINLGFKFGGGYFWGDGKADNIINSDFQMHGGVINSEFYISKFNTLVPLEVFIGYTGFIFTEPLVLNANAFRLDLGKPYFHSLSFGMRISLWNDHCYDLLD